MRRFWIAVGLGMAAGVIDVAPMLVMNTDVFACISAFLHWVFLGIVIVYIDWPIMGWLKGLIIAWLAALPVAAMVYPVDSAGVVPILIISPLLGMVVGYLSEKLGIQATITGRLNI